MLKKNPAQIRFHLKWTHTITKKTDNINMDSTIVVNEYLFYEYIRINTQHTDVENVMKTTLYDAGNPGHGLGHVHTWGEIKLVNGTPNFSSLNNCIYNSNTRINKINDKKNSPEQIRFHLNKAHTITTMNDSIHVDRTLNVREYQRANQK